MKVAKALLGSIRRTSANYVNLVRENVQYIDTDFELSLLPEPVRSRKQFRSLLDCLESNDKGLGGMCPVDPVDSAFKVVKALSERVKVLSSQRFVASSDNSLAFGEERCHGVRVVVEATCGDDRNNIFVYTVRIVNENSDVSVQLLSREWEIAHAAGTVSHVQGAGVVGQMPKLAPGEEHVYRSHCQTLGPYATQQGNYTFELSGSHVVVPIAPFGLFREREPLESSAFFRVFDTL
jgi:ApaG protein